MTDIFKKPLFIIIVVVAILIAVGWTYYEKVVTDRQVAKEQQAVEEAAKNVANLTNIDPAEFDEFVKKEYAEANKKALEADKKNVLGAIVVELPGDLKPNSGNDRYAFTSPTNTTNNWVITFSQQTGNYLRSNIYKDDYLGNLQAIDTTLWKFNYVTALQIADKNGGSDWRANNTLKGVTLTLKHGLPNNWLLWTVEYTSTTGSTLDIKIDANSGKIVE